MLVGGIVFEFIHPVWKSVPKFTPAVTLNMLFLIFIGTALSYYLFVKSLHLISATEATLLDTFEPLTAALLDFLIFKMQFNWAEILGSLLVISTVFILLLEQKKKTAIPKKNR
jgi:drug/metabolite transporter (DMT)-like permease